MASTTNYSWSTPDDTALVKDGAAAIRSLGTSIDTTTKALNPSTTLGDIEYRSSTANTNTRLAIGSTGNVLTVSGGVPVWAAPAGGAQTIKQIVTSVISTDTSTTSTSYVDTGLTATITPSSTGSKIIVMYCSPNATINGSATGMTSVNGYSRLMRGATAVVTSNHGMDLFASSNYKTPYIPFTITYLDSPASTSALTYKVQYKGSSTEEFVISKTTAPATLILMEI